MEAHLELTPHLLIAYLGGGLMNLTSFFTSIMKGMGAGARVFSLIEREPKIRLGVGKEVPHALPTLEFRDVGFSYPSRPEMKVLDGFNLKVEPGTSIAVCGPSGIGKTSVHALALRLYDPQSGRIMLNGVDIREYKPESLRSVFRVVGQDPVSVLANIDIARLLKWLRRSSSMDPLQRTSPTRMKARRKTKLKRPRALQIAWTLSELYR
jgi:ABC-type multidrug transport system fused ATPase/permease subunit